MKQFLEVVRNLENGDQLDASVSDRGRGVRITEHLANVLSLARGAAVQKFDEAIDGTIALVTNAKRYASHRWRYLLQEAASASEFPLLFGNVLERQLLAKYRIQAPDWRSYIGAGSQRDFRSMDVLGVYGLQAVLPTKADSGEYKQDKQLGEGRVQISLTEYGRLWGVQWKTLINDDLGAFQDVPERLANAALVTEYREATKLIAGASGPHTSLYGAALTHPITGQTVANLGTAAFDEAGVQLAAAITAMREFQDSDGNPIVIDGFELVVPPALEITAMKALNPAALVLTGTTDAVRSSANVVANLNIRLHVNPYLPIISSTANGDTTWYLFARLASGQSARLNFLRGHETPELVMKAANKVAVGGGPLGPMEGDFETDTVWFRVRHILGGVQIDPLFTWASDGSA